MCDCNKKPYVFGVTDEKDLDYYDVIKIKDITALFEFIEEHGGSVYLKVSDFNENEGHITFYESC